MIKQYYYACMELIETPGECAKQTRPAFALDSIWGSMLMNHGMRVETVNRTGSDDYCYIAGTELQNRRGIG